MTRASQPSFKVALVWRGDRQARLDARPETSRLHAIFDALGRRGVQAEPAVFSEDISDEVRDQLFRMDGVLVWVDPISGGLRRDSLDELLRDVASAGVFVSTHPDVIRKMGVKAALYWTKALGWGTDTHFYETPEVFAAQFPPRLAQDGPRVLKQNRGNGGIGVWKVTGRPDGIVDILSARGDGPSRALLLADFVAERREDFGLGGGLVDQPFQARHMEGMVRCYMSGDRVVGFGHQLVRALASRDAGPAGPRLYSGANDDRFQRLRAEMEGEWTPGMTQVLGIETSDLPVIWDADFLLGPKTPAGNDTYVLCEINVSSVFPIPGEAPDALADTLLCRLEARARAFRNEERRPYRKPAKGTAAPPFPSTGTGLTANRNHLTHLSVPSPERASGRRSEDRSKHLTNDSVRD